MSQATKVETLVDYTVHYSDEAGATRRKRFRLESQMARFVDETPSTYRVDTSHVSMAWLAPREEAQPLAVSEPTVEQQEGIVA